MTSTGTITLDPMDNHHNAWVLTANVLDTTEGLMTTWNSAQLDVRLYSQVLQTFHNTDSSYTVYIKFYESARWIDSTSYPAGDPLTNPTRWTQRGTTLVLPPDGEDYISFSLGGTKSWAITAYASNASYTEDALVMDLAFDPGV